MLDSHGVCLLTHRTLIAGGLQLTTAFVPSMAAAAWTSLIGIITVAVFLVMVITVAFMTHPAPGTCYAPLIQGGCQGRLQQGSVAGGVYEDMSGVDCTLCRLLMKTKC